ncbi:deoxynucleoside kinase [Spiroplasma endosymbiont of Crioceris asparagi]|uniref:deoxynucleoside kinase n=1 Tax=Spiroplasma endosymbiont of Crioceris asparagi TaxID=3066286 RepID=UPI0030D1982E
MRIALFGTVGAGKSTMSEILSKKLNAEIFPEPVDNNPYFDDYYRDMPNFIFKMQIWMLTARSRQLIHAMDIKNVIFDRTILEDPIFVQVNHDLKRMNDIDFQTYNNFYNEVVLPSLQERANFDVVVYLRLSAEKSIERIVERGRPQEVAADHSYWELLNKRYEDFYQKNKNKFNFLVIDAENDNLEKKASEVIEHLKKLTK